MSENMLLCFIHCWIYVWSITILLKSHSPCMYDQFVMALEDLVGSCQGPAVFISVQFDCVPVNPTAHLLANIHKNWIIRELLFIKDFADSETRGFSPSAGCSVPDLLQQWCCSVCWLKMAPFHQLLQQSTLEPIKSSSHTVIVWFNKIIVIMLSVMISFMHTRCLIFVFIAVIFQLLLCTLQMTVVRRRWCETYNNEAPLFIPHYIVLSLLLVLSRFCMDGTLWRQSNTFSHC